MLRTIIGWLLRLYSYLFHLILSLFLIGIAIVAISARNPLVLGMLPWEGYKLNYWVLGLSLFAIVCILLAVTGIVRFLFPLWTLFVFAMMLRGFFLTPYDFGGDAQFKQALWLTFAAFLAFLCSLSLLFPRKRKPLAAFVAKT